MRIFGAIAENNYPDYVLVLYHITEIGLQRERYQREHERENYHFQNTQIYERVFDHFRVRVHVGVFHAKYTFWVTAKWKKVHLELRYENSSFKWMFFKDAVHYHDNSKPTFTTGIFMTISQHKPQNTKRAASVNGMEWMGF